MPEMPEGAWRAFITSGTRTGKLATVCGDGRPHVTPVWFLLNGDEIVLTTHQTSLKGRNIQRDGRVCLCVDDQEPPFSYVMIEGAARCSTGLDELRRWAARIGGRYMGADRAEEYGRRNGVPGELLIRVTPTRIVAEERVAG
ncbi:MAG TPA: PPOX class F420-dependent oxidoreductase [Actinomycetes bacterium]|jgi:PPOX class probable F420-dependent enzyme|nr:PPOX class F420-dependent oxidoreductase [Actinomycetes bacterium]